MTVRRRRLLPLMAGLMALPSSACSTGDDPAGVDDGAAIEVVTAWAEAVRSGDGETACRLATPAFAELLVAEAMSFGAEPTTSCVRAVPTLTTVEFAPPPVTEHVVESTTDEQTVLTLRFRHREPQTATLVRTDGGWLLDSLKDAPEPT